MRLSDIGGKLSEGYRVVPGFDREKYQERQGLEGPFHTKSGKVVYYDKVEGKYYDPDTDMYIEYDDWQAMNEQGVAEGLDAEAYKEKLLATLPQMMRFYEKNVKGWKPSEEQMLAAVETGYTVMKHTGDVNQAGKAVMDELNTLHRMSQGQQGVAEGSFHNPGQEDSPVAQAITRRILLQRTDLLAKYGPEKVGQAIDEVADFVGDVDEIGSSDVSGWVRQVETNLKDSAVGESEEQAPKSALGKALWRDLSKFKKASPAQQQRNKERWAQRQKEREQGVAEGAKVDRMVKHIAKSEREAGKSAEEAEDIAWATANKRGYLDNKNKKAK